VYLERLPRPLTLRFDRRFLPGRKGLTSLQSVSPVFLPTDHCPPTCRDPVGVTAHYCFKSFSCNTYESPRKCCKQETYVQAKPFRCNTRKKQGPPIDLPTFGRSDSPTPFLSNIYGLTHGNRRSASPFFQSLAHSFRCDGGVCSGVPPQASSASMCQRQTYPQSLPHYFVSLPIRPIAAKRPWCHNWQSRANSSRSGETTPLSPVSKTTRADIGNCSTPLPVTDSGQIGVASRA